MAAISEKGRNGFHSDIQVKVTEESAREVVHDWIKIKASPRNAFQSKTSTPLRPQRDVHNTTRNSFDVTDVPVLPPPFATDTPANHKIPVTRCSMLLTVLLLPYNHSMKATGKGQHTGDFKPFGDV